MNFNRHDLLTLHGVAYRPFESNDDFHVLERVDASGLHESYSHKALWELSRTNNYRYEKNYFAAEKAAVRAHAEVANLSEIDPSERETILMMVDYCNVALAMYGQGKLKKTEASISRHMPEIEKAVNDLIASRNGRKPSQQTGKYKTRVRKAAVMSATVAPCAKTLLVWMRTYLRGGCHPLALRQKLRNCGNHNSHIGREAAALLALTALNYAHPNKPTKEEVYGDIERAFGLRPDLKAPGRKAMRNAIDRLDPFFVLTRREGEDAAKKIYAWVTSGLQVDHPGHRVQIDEWEFDLISLASSTGLWELLTDEERKTISRVRRWLSLVIDCSTRIILGMRITKTQSKEGALATLEMACTEKGSFADAVGALSSWHQCAAVKSVEADWGANYASDRFRSAVADLGATMEFPPAGAASARGMVERAFGTLVQQLVSRMNGRTFSNVVLRGDYASKDLAGLTDDEIAYAIVRYVVDAYHNSPHAGLNGETPYNNWERVTGIRGVPAPVDGHRRRTVFGQIHQRIITNRGLRFLGNFYTSRELGEYFLHSRKSERKVEIRVDLNNLGAISVKLGDAFVAVPCREESMEGVRAANWVATMTALRRKHRHSAKLARPTVLAALAAVDAINDGALKRANIATPLPNEEEIERAERDIFFGYEMLEDDAPAGDVLGDVIAPADLAPILREIVDPVEKKTKKSKSRKPAVATSVVIAPDSEDDSDAWTTRG